MTFLLIAIGVIGGIGILFCIYMAISKASRDKQNRENKSDSEESVDTLLEECSDPRVAEGNIRKVIRTKRDSAQKKLDELQPQIKALRDDTSKMQDKLILRHDDDIDRLNKIYSDFDPNTTGGNTFFFQMQNI